MARPIALALFIATTLAGARSPAQSGPMASANHLEPLAFLVGTCWKGTFPDGKQTDEHCFEWMFDHKFIRDRHTVRGGAPYAGETVYAWDAEKRQLVFAYWNSDGQVMNGSVAPGADGLVFPTRLITEKDTTEIKAVWTRRGADSYHVTNSQRTPAGWRVLWTMEMKR